MAKAKKNQAPQMRLTPLALQSAAKAEKVAKVKPKKYPPADQVLDQLRVSLGYDLDHILRRLDAIAATGAAQAEVLNSVRLYTSVLPDHGEVQRLRNHLAVQVERVRRLADEKDLALDFIREQRARISALELQVALHAQIITTPPTLHP